MIKNTTSVPTFWIQRMLAEIWIFAEKRDQRIPAFSFDDLCKLFTIKNSSATHMRGLFYHQSHKITIKVTPYFQPEIVSEETRLGGAYLTGYAIGSWEESIVFLLAHELRHLWQTRNKPTTYGSRGRFSERDADAFALAFLRYYRRNLSGATLC